MDPPPHDVWTQSEHFHGFLLIHREKHQRVWRGGGGLSSLDGWRCVSPAGFDPRRSWGHTPPAEPWRLQTAGRRQQVSQRSANHSQSSS